MAQSKGSVRIGPVSLFVLVIALCLAVLAVLSVTTAHAQAAITNQQAIAITDAYKNEIAAQEFMAAIDDQLAQAQSRAETPEQLQNSMVSFIDEYNDRDGNQGLGESALISYDDSVITAEFGQASGRLLTIKVAINSNYTYLILAWQATTDWEEPGSDTTFWAG